MVARGDIAAFDSGVVAEIVERAAWAKVGIVRADEREQDAAGGRIALNLGHTVAHALEVVDGYASLLHGEAVAYGLRAAVRIGSRMGSARVTSSPDREAPRSPRLGQTRLTYAEGRVIAATESDKKHAGGLLRWVLPTADGVVVRDDVPDDIVAQAVRSTLAGGPSPWAEHDGPGPVGPLPSASGA